MPTNGLQTDPWIGRILGGRYHVAALIARGSMGAVYLAHDTSGQAFAIKLLELLAETPDRQERAVARFLRESASLSRLAHPNTVRIYDVGTDLGYSWLAMEHVQGRSLEEVLGTTPMDPLRMVRIIRQVCGSVAEAHAHGLIHRDLKPANVLVRTDLHGQDHAKVVDFGLVKQMEGNQHLTAQGLLVGTPMYMSPEQVRGATDIDQRSDLYSLGIMMYRILTGYPPFLHDSTAAVLLAHLSEPPQPLPAALRIPASLELLVRRCLHKDRDQRLQSASSLADALTQVESVLLGHQGDGQAIARIRAVSLPPTTVARLDGTQVPLSKRPPPPDMTSWMWALIWLVPLGVLVGLGATTAALGSFVAVQLLLRL